MAIFLKYILKSMIEKKGRFLLLLIAISLSTGLFVASLGTVDIAIDAMSKPQLELYENKDILISSNKEGTFFDGNGINEEGVKNLIKEIQMGAYYNIDDETMQLNIRGRDNEYINNKYIIEGSLDEFTGAKCIISKRISKERNLHVGDKIDIILAGQTTTLEIAGIYGNSGMFYSDTRTYFTLLLPYEYLSSNLGYEGLYNLVLGNSTEDNLQKSIKKFNEGNSDYEATKLFDRDEIKEETSSFTQILYYMLTIVVFMSAIIIYSSFKLTITERMPIVGTFLSQGATKGTIKRILYLESVCYGILGAILGITLGVVGLNIISKMVSPLAEYGIYESFNIPYSYLIIGFVFSLALSFISAVIPIKKIRKLQIKEVILNDVNVSMSIGYRKLIIGICILALCIGVSFIDEKWVDNLGIFFIILTFISLILIYPKVVDTISKILYKILRGKSKSLVLALNNIRTSKVLLGNTTLIIISMIAIFMIGSIGTSMVDTVTKAYEEMEYDICINGISTIRQGEISVAEEIINELKNVDGYVEESANILSWGYSYVNKDDSKFLYSLGVNPKKFLEYNKYLELDSKENKKEYKDFLEGKEGIVITTLLSEKYKINKGDVIKLNCNDMDKEIKVLGIINGKMYNNGYFCLISDATLKSVYNYSGGDEVNLKTNKSPDEFKKDLKFLTTKYGVSISTRDEQLERNKEDNAMLVDILNIFSFMAIIIAALGVLNNITIGFLQRKRDMAVIASIGMQRKNRNIMIIFESIITVFWATIVSIPGCILVLRLLTKALKPLEIQIDIKIDFSLIPLYIVATLIIVIIATIPVLFKSKKLSVINELKYE